jgi:hypothetical protein
MMQPDLARWTAHDIFPHVVYVRQEVIFALPQRSSSEGRRSEKRAQMHSVRKLDTEHVVRRAHCHQSANNTL